MYTLHRSKSRGRLLPPASAAAIEVASAHHPRSVGTSGRRPTRSRDSRLAAAFAALITLAVVAAAPGVLNIGPVDDAYISLRYATNWANGTGLCFNSGERVEGYTNFLLVLLQTTAIKLGVTPEHALVAIPMLALAMLAGVLVLFAAEHLFPDRISHATAAGLIIALNPVMVCWAVAGMESCLFALLLTVSLLLLLGRIHPRRLTSSAIFLVLAGMTRPEAAAICPLVILFVYFRCRSVRRVVQFAAVFAFGFGTYFCIRALHFGQLFPNTFYAKLDYGSGLLILRGLGYVWRFACAMSPTLLLCVAAVLLIRSAPTWVKALATIIVAQICIVAYEGGDHFAMYRFMVPVIPLIGLVALYPCVVVAGRCRPRSLMGTVAVPLGLAAIAVSGLLACKRIKADEPETVTQYARFQKEADYARQWKQIGRWLHEHAPADASVATIAIGAVGYYSDLRIVDPFGLIDPEISRSEQALGAGYAGHEKFDIDRIFAKRPDYILLVNYLTLQPIAEDAIAAELWGEFNHRLHAEPRLNERYRYESVPIGTRWLNIHIRQDAPLTRPDVAVRHPAVLSLQKVW